jgi:porphobilinogen deaminase
MTVTVATQESPLSETHISEIYEELKKHHPGITIRSLLIKNSDKNSVKKLPAHEVDFELLKRRCNAVVHHVDDVIEPLERGLTIAAVTAQKMAIVTHKNAHAMLKLFSCLDKRNKKKTPV